MTEHEIDQYVWNLHCQHCWDTGMPHWPPCTRAAWEAYMAKLREESTGYWHGMTGRLVERLRISDEEWRFVVAVQRGGVASRSLGDSSHECCYLIESSARWD
jgi:hypothetical protein